MSTLGISNIAGLEDALAAKADKDHNHDERYAPKAHHHNEYAHRTHRHNWDDFDGKPNNLATTDNVKAAVEGIQIGGRNYVLNSKEKRTSVGYYGQYWGFSETMIVGKQYVLSCYVSGNYSLLHIYFRDIEGQPRQYITTTLKEGYNEVKVIPKYAWTGLCAYHEVYGVSPVPTVAIEKVKLERGNKPTDWTPAPEDLTPERLWGRQQHSSYGEVNASNRPIVTREVFLDNPNSRANVWTADNELHVGSRAGSGYAKTVTSGYKVAGLTNDRVLLAGGDHISITELLATPRGYDTSTSVALPATVVNDAVFVKATCTLGLQTLPNRGSVSFRKVFDGGEVIFTCEEKSITYTGDTQFNGKRGSTAVVSVYDNECYIDIRNV